MKKPVEEDSPFYRFVMHLYIELLMQLLFVRVQTEGLEKVPQQGRFLLVCNHQQMADPGILLHFFRKSQLAFISKKENEKLPLINKFLHKILCQSIERNNDRQGLRVIVKCVQLIREDMVSVAVFPEGYTSKDGKLHPFRCGVFKIAQKTGVPIVVCTIRGTDQIFHNAPRLKATQVQLHLVDVLQPEQYAGKSTTQIGEMVYETMIRDLGEDFRWDPEKKTRENS
jgi:1-acyl-sn-glycerol-3-phosphate acyltransferase